MGTKNMDYPNWYIQIAFPLAEIKGYFKEKYVKQRMFDIFYEEYRRIKPYGYVKESTEFLREEEWFVLKGSWRKQDGS
jgi:hypothetical protein